MRNIERRAAVICFLIGAKAENQMFNGRTATDAYQAFCELFGYDPVMIEAKLRGDGGIITPGPQT